MFNKIIQFLLRNKPQISINFFGIEILISKNNHIWIKGVNALILDYQIGFLSTRHGCQNYEEMEQYLRSKVDAYSDYEKAILLSPKVQVLLAGDYVDLSLLSIPNTPELSLYVNSKTCLISDTPVPKKQSTYTILPIYL